MKPLRMALTKGRLEKDTVALLERIGYDCEAVHNKGRKLILPVGDRLEVVLAKAADVITYVEHGVCDLGVVGKDTIMENGTSFYEVLDLGFGRCKFALPRRKEAISLAGMLAGPLLQSIPMWRAIILKARRWTSASSRSKDRWSWPPCWGCPMPLSILWKRYNPERKWLGGRGDHL